MARPGFSNSSRLPEPTTWVDQRERSFLNQLIKTISQNFQKMEEGIGSTLDGRFLQIQDQKSSGTDGGTATSGSWFTRDLNTTVQNEINSGLASNVFTLNPGVYYIEASVPCGLCDSTQLRLYNVTDAAVAILGHTERFNGVYGRVSLSGKVTVNANTEFRLEQRVETTRATDGLGNAAGFGTEVYSEIKAWQIG